MPTVNFSLLQPQLAITLDSSQMDKQSPSIPSFDLPPPYHPNTCYAQESIDRGDINTVNLPPETQPLIRHNVVNLPPCPQWAMVLFFMTIPITIALLLVMAFLEKIGFFIKSR